MEASVQIRPCRKHRARGGTPEATAPRQAPLREGKQVGGKPTPECRLARLGARARRRDPLEVNVRHRRKETRRRAWTAVDTRRGCGLHRAARPRTAKRRASTASRRSCAPASIPELTQKRCAGASRPYSAPRRFASRPHRDVAGAPWQSPQRSKRSSRRPYSRSRYLPAAMRATTTGRLRDWAFQQDDGPRDQVTALQR